MSDVGIILGLVLLLVALGAVELMLHARALARIPVRVHVNGTRGKSSVTRLIAAGLRAGDKRTVAKTTGTLARIILPDGEEQSLSRPAGPNILEQLRVIRAAAAERAEVLVVECMAVQPALQALSELRIVRSTHGVITNARADHLDAMGPTEADVALALAATTPVRGVLFSSEGRHRAVFEAAARDRESAFVAVGPDEAAAVGAAELAGFAHLEHPENVALALRVCAALGVDRGRALRGMWAAAPDPGALFEARLERAGASLIFVSAFAANDPESTTRVCALAASRHPEVTTRLALVNCRPDRPERSTQLGEAAVRWAAFDRFVLVGGGSELFARAARAAGVPAARLSTPEARSAEELFLLLLELAGPSALIVGVGNIGGLGLELARRFSSAGAAGARSPLALEGPS